MSERSPAHWSLLLQVTETDSCVMDKFDNYLPLTGQEFGGILIISDDCSVEMCNSSPLRQPSGEAGPAQLTVQQTGLSTALILVAAHRMSLAKRATLKQAVTKMPASGVIEESESPRMT